VAIATLSGTKKHGSLLAEHELPYSKTGLPY